MCRECLAFSGAAQAGGAWGGTSGALRGVPVTLPDFLMTGALKAGTTTLPTSPRTGRIAEVTWTRNSPAWTSGGAVLHRATVAPGNPGCAGVVLPSCRHCLDSRRITCRTRRLRGLAVLPAIAIPAVTPGGMADGNFPAIDHQPLQPPPDSGRSS
jgi:hypothetical protein